MKKRKKLSRKGLAFLLAVAVSFSLFSMDFFPARALMSDNENENDGRMGLTDDFDGDESIREYIVYFENDIGKGRIPFRDTLGSDLLKQAGISADDGVWDSANADVLRFDSSGRAVVYGEGETEITYILGKGKEKARADEPEIIGEDEELLFDDRGDLTGAEETMPEGKQPEQTEVGDAAEKEAESQTEQTDGLQAESGQAGQGETKADAGQTDGVQAESGQTGQGETEADAGQTDGMRAESGQVGQGKAGTGAERTDEIQAEPDQAGQGEAEAGVKQTEETDETGENQTEELLSEAFQAEAADFGEGFFSRVFDYGIRTRSLNIGKIGEEAGLSVAADDGPKTGSGADAGDSLEAGKTEDSEKRENTEDKSDLNKSDSNEKEQEPERAADDKVSGSETADRETDHRESMAGKEESEESGKPEMPEEMPDTDETGKAEESAAAEKPEKTEGYSEENPKEAVGPQETASPEGAINPEESIRPEETVSLDETLSPQESVRPEGSVKAEESVETEGTAKIKEQASVKAVSPAAEEDEGSGLSWKISIVEKTRDILQVQEETTVKLDWQELGASWGNIQNDFKLGYADFDWADRSVSGEASGAELKLTIYKPMTEIGEENLTELLGQIPIEYQISADKDGDGIYGPEEKLLGKMTVTELETVPAKRDAAGGEYLLLVKGIHVIEGGSINRRALETFFAERETKIKVVPGKSQTVYEAGTKEEFDRAVKAAISNKSGTVRLLNDIDLTGMAITLTESSAYLINKDTSLILDLNGCKLNTGEAKANAYFFKVYGSFTLTDSGNDAKPVPVKTGEQEAGEAGKSAKYENGVLTYYVTESDPDVTGTKETLVTYEIDLGGEGTGRIENTYGNLFHVRNSGTLILDGGIIERNSGDTAIWAGDTTAQDKGIIKILGGYIVGSGTGDETNIVAPVALRGGSELYMGGGGICGNIGGGIFAQDSMVTIGGNAVIAGNYAPGAGSGGGAVCLFRRANVNKDGGLTVRENAVIAGNRAEGNGGGIISANGYTITVKDNCYITNNRSETSTSDDAIYKKGGGGICTSGVLNIEGGYITGNYAADSGGGIYASHSVVSDRPMSNWNGRSTFLMSGGIIAGNRADKREGGGIRCAGDGEIYGGFITNNSTGTTYDLGGGGIFVRGGSPAGTLTIANALITNNTAEGFGGGIGGCTKGDTHILEVKGPAIFGNHAAGTATTVRPDGSQIGDGNEQDNKALRDAGCYEAYYCAGISEVHGEMLGGGSPNWTGAGRLAENGEIERFSIADGEMKSGWTMALSSEPDESAQKRAIDFADVIISGNYSSIHGGGIGNNGILNFGFADNAQEKEETTSLTVSKRIEGEDIEAEKEFTFVITMSTDKGSLRGSYPYQKFVGGVESDADVFASGSKITLKHNESVTISGMPEGTRYTVTEAKTAGYISSLDDGSDKAQGQLFGENGKTVRFVNTKEAPNPEETTSPADTTGREESTDPSSSTTPTEPENPSGPTEPTEPENPSDPTGQTDPADPSNPTEPTTPAEPTKRPHSGGGGNDPTPKSSTEVATQPETPAESVADTNPATEPGIDPAPNPGGGAGQLPDPNDPDSPESIVIMEEGVPRTYLKVWNPEEEAWVYLPEDEVPLAWLLPPTGDESGDILWVLLYLTSLGGIAMLIWMEWRRRARK